MSIDLWALPGPRRLLRELREALAQGRSVLLLHPAGTSMERLEERLMRASPHRLWRPVDLGELEQRTGTLVQRLLDHLGHGDLAADGGVEALVERMRRSVLWLAPPSGEWLRDGQLSRLLTDFTSAAAKQEQHERAVIACACPPQYVNPLPPSGGGLLRQCWWGQISPLDTLVVVDEALDHPRVVGDREVIAELAGWDLDLAERLALEWSGDARCDVGILVPERRDRWHGGGLIDEAHSASASAITPDPPDELFAAWANGCIDWWGDRALVHLGCHLAHGDDDVLDRRIWRGQVVSVLPLVELARERLARWVEQRSHLIAAEWAYRDVTRLEVGPLERLFGDSPGLRRSVDHHELARVLRRVRHELAHVNGVDRDLLRRLEELLRGELFV